MIIHTGGTTAPYTSLYCIIPARSGSKGLASKNSLALNGLPLAEHSVKFALTLPGLSGIIFSTDSSYLLKRSSLYPSVKYLNRDPGLASDSSTLVDVVLDIYLSHLSSTAGPNPAFFLLQPTSPFRCSSEVSSALKLSSLESFQSLAAVTPNPCHPCESIMLAKNRWRYISPPPHPSSRRQDYRVSSFFITGSFYLATLSFLREHGSFVGSTSSFFQTNEPSIVDIDTASDFALAQALFPFMLSKNYAVIL